MSAATEFEQGDVVKVRGEVCRYNGRLQLNLEKLRIATADEFELADYVPHTSKDVEELWSALAPLLADRPTLRPVFNALCDAIAQADGTLD